MAAGVAAAVLGLFAARQWALAAGGTIVLMSALLFALASLAVSVRRAFGRPTPTPDPGALLTGPH